MKTRVSGVGLYHLHKVTRTVNSPKTHTLHPLVLPHYVDKMSWLALGRHYNDSSVMGGEVEQTNPNGPACPPWLSSEGGCIQLALFLPHGPPRGLRRETTAPGP